MYTKKLGKTIAKIQKGGHRDKGTKEKKKSAFFDPKVEAKKIVERLRMVSQFEIKIKGMEF